MPSWAIPIIEAVASIIEQLIVHFIPAPAPTPAPAVNPAPAPAPAKAVAEMDSLDHMREALHHLRMAKDKSVPSA